MGQLARVVLAEEPECQPTKAKLMKLHPEKTERGWEMADETGTFESFATSSVFVTKAQCQIEINREQSGCQWDELRALETMIH